MIPTAGRAGARALALALLAGFASARGALAQDPAPSAAPTAKTNPPAAAGKGSARPRQVDARADELMRKMSQLLARTPRLALEADETFDEVYAAAPRVQFTNLRRMAVVRPDHFAADASGDTLNRASWYDGKTLTALDKDNNTYMKLESPGTVDSTLDKVADLYDVVIPLSDFVYSDPYATLMEGVVYGEYLGIHQAAGVPCHHLAFSQQEVDWQIWIDAGELPLPRKLLISYSEEPGVPQYTATVRRWSLDPKFGDDLFVFEAPEGAKQVPLPPARNAAAPPAAEKKEGSR
jgi:hypothetical protein